MTELLGVIEEHACTAMRGKSGRIFCGQSIRLEWLIETFSGITNEHSQTEMQLIYILFLFRCTLFANKSSTRVPLRYLRLLANVNKISRYASGTGRLAYLYRQLGVFGRYGSKQLLGYLALFQV